MKTYLFKKEKDTEVNHALINCWFAREFDLLPFGKYEIVIRKPQRSNPQNALFWMWCACIAQETGVTPNEVYQFYCETYNLKNEAKFTYNRYGSMVSGATHQMPSNEYTEFLNNIKVHASSELGIILPLPEDLAFNDFKERFSQYVPN